MPGFVSGAFYLPDGHRFESTELTRGPWSEDSQHGGPPAALLGREIERCDARQGFQVARVTFEILKPVPIAPLEVGAEVLRPGRSVELVEATLSAEGEAAMRARAWRIRTTSLELGGAPEAAPSDPAPDPPDRGSVPEFFLSQSVTGYHTAMDFRFVKGAFLEPGPAITWLRMRTPLVGGEEPSPLQRVLVAADTGNGISAMLDPRRYLFINTDLTVHLHRLPRGEWVCLNATTTAELNGIGMTDSAVYDEHGRIGRAAQSLLIGER